MVENGDEPAALDLVRTVSRVFGARATAAMVMVVGYALFARSLGATAFGSFVLFLALVNVLEVFVDVGVDRAVEKRISECNRPTAPSDVLATALSMKAVFFVLIGTVLVALRAPIDSYVGTEVTDLLIAVLVVQQVGWLMLHVLKGEMAIDTAEFLDLVRQFVFVGLGLVLVYIGLGIDGVIYGYGISWTVVSVWAYAITATGFGGITTGAFHSLLAFSKYDFIASALRYSAYSWIDVLIIGLFLSQAHVAAYEIAWQIAGAVMLLSHAIAQTLFPQISDWASRDVLDEVERVIPDALTASLFFVFPAIVGATIVGYDVLMIVFGPEFTIATLALVVLLIGKIGEGMNNVYGTVLLALDRPDLVALSSVVFIALNAVLNVVLIVEFGIAGAAVATSLAFGVYTAMNWRYLSRYLTPRANVLDIGTLVAAASCMGVVVWVARSITDTGSTVALVAVISLGAVTYGVAILAVPSFRNRIFARYVAE